MNTEKSNGKTETQNPVGSSELVRARAPDEPKTLMEWLWRLKRYEDGIYVREQNPDGKWGNARLSELSPERWAFHVARWLEEGALPCRILEPDERPKSSAKPQSRGSLQPDGSATIYPSQDAATAALLKCPRPKGGQYDHWWYIDSPRIGESPDYIPCVCGTCGQKMNLSVDADDYPAT